MNSNRSLKKPRFQLLSTNKSGDVASKSTGLEILPEKPGPEEVGWEGAVAPPGLPNPLGPEKSSPWRFRSGKSSKYW